MANNGENPSPNVGGKTVKLKADDGEIFEVEEAVAMELQTVKSFFDDDGVSYDTVVPLLNVSSTALAKVIQYCRRALELRAKSGDDEGVNEKAREEREGLEAELVREESDEGIKELILAANYLNIKDMLSFLCRAVGDRIKNKSVECVRRFFVLENDYSLEEEERTRNEVAWAFEGVDAD
jgi:S-phase kinase-associated protein 1